LAHDDLDRVDLSIGVRDRDFPESVSQTEQLLMVEAWEASRT
jgi:hypothetical protein